MADEFKTTIGQLATFIICAQAITHFRPRDSYAKYLRMLLSVIILVQIFQPFCHLLWGISGAELYAGVEAFQEELDKSMAAAVEQSARVGAQLESMSLLEVQERLIRQEKENTESEKMQESERTQGVTGQEAEIMVEQSAIEAMQQLQGEENIGESNVKIDEIESIEIVISEE